MFKKIIDFFKSKNKNMEEKKNSVVLIGKLLGKKDERVFNAELAWIESTYGTGSYKTIDVRIKEKQDYITYSIENKFKRIYQDGQHSYSAYHCVIDIEEDLATYVDTIFEPFKKNGFAIINLSEQVKEIDEPHVYLVSWKNAFKHKVNNTNSDKQLLEE